MYSIAIDGPVSSGKSTVAKILAKRLNILHLNTGALYRAIGLYAQRNNLLNAFSGADVSKVNKSEIEMLINNANVDVKFINGNQHTFLNGEDVTNLIHNPIISDYSSRVSVIKEVRDHVLFLQRDIASKQSVVMEGRDITSHVLPSSKYKFYLTASAEVRADRRYKEELSKGIKTTFKQVLKDVKMRDLRDTTRDICPLIITDDAVVINTDDINEPEKVADKILTYIKEK